MKVALAYDRWASYEPDASLPDDFGAEFDDEATITGLLRAIDAAGHEAARLPVDEELPQRLRRLHLDLVFNIAEGTRGPSRESLVPAWLDHLGIPYTGSDGLTLGCSLDKALTKTLVEAAGVRTLPYKRVGSVEQARQADLNFPVFVKPNREGSSMGVRRTSLVRDAEALGKRTAWVLNEYNQDCLIEEYAPGREFCVGLLGNAPPEILPVVEILNEEDFYSYELKSRHQKRLVCPADICDELRHEMQDMALSAYRTLRCRDLARVDFKLDGNGRPVFLEINPLPGLSSDYSIYPHQAEKAGHDYDGLIAAIIDGALKRAHITERTQPCNTRTTGAGNCETV
ncbi:MAG: D-alanine--D-alanine ligase family protein [Planctomycetota bacterium]